MGLSEAISSAASGLRVAQAGLSLVSANVANAQTPGYVRKSLVQQAMVFGDAGIGVRTAGINRELDAYVQAQLRTETSGGGYATLKSQLYQQLQQLYGTPGSTSAIDSGYNTFTNSLQALVTSPADYSARQAVVGAAQTLAQQLNSLSGNIQNLRGAAEQGIADSVRSANDALQQIAQINQSLMNSATNDASRASLLDQRDNAIGQLSQFMDIRVVPGDHESLNVFTGSGIQLVGTEAAQLTFDTHEKMTPDAQWSADPTKRGVGTITLLSPGGGTLDLIANKAIRSGQIAAFLEMRDSILPQAQRQIDEFAAGMASALSDQTTAGTPAVSGGASGFTVDTAAMQDGNSVTFTYTDTPSNIAHKITLVRVDDPSALPLRDMTTANPNDRIIGVDWSLGVGAAAASLNNLFSGRLNISASGTNLQILDDGGANHTDVNSLAVTTTTATLSGGSAQLPLFTDGTSPYSGSYTSTGPQLVGFASRIAVNPGLVADPSKLVIYQPATASGDQTRPSFLYNTLIQNALSFSPKTGVGSVSAPYSGTLSGYWRQVMSQQGDAATAAQNLSVGQTQVVNALQQRFNDQAGVNIDEEMSNLLTLQTSYGANARVLTTVKDMMQLLMQM